MLMPLANILKCLCDRQAHVDDYHLYKQTLMNVIIIESPANRSTFWVWERMCDYTSGWKGNHSHRWSCSLSRLHQQAHDTSNCSGLLKTLWSDQTVHRGDFRNSQRGLKPLLCWNRHLAAYKDKRNKYQPATVFVALNIPPVRSDFPNLAMRAILEWTPGRAWRQSGKREQHSNDFKPLRKKMKIYRDPLSRRTLRGHHSDTKPSLTNTFKVWLWMHSEPIELLHSVQREKSNTEWNVRPLWS